jgi:hypothetical protein
MSIIEGCNFFQGISPARLKAIEAISEKQSYAAGSSCSTVVNRRGISTFWEKGAFACDSARAARWHLRSTIFL